MVLINPIDYIMMLDLLKYIFVAFVFYGVFLCLKKLIFGKKVDL